MSLANEIKSVFFKQSCAPSSWWRTPTSTPRRGSWRTPSGSTTRMGRAPIPWRQVLRSYLVLYYIYSALWPLPINTIYNLIFFIDLVNVGFNCKLNDKISSVMFIEWEWTSRKEDEEEEDQWEASIVSVDLMVVSHSRRPLHQSQATSSSPDQGLNSDWSDGWCYRVRLGASLTSLILLQSEINSHLTVISEKKFFNLKNVLFKYLYIYYIITCYILSQCLNVKHRIFQFIYKVKYKQIN